MKTVSLWGIVDELPFREHLVISHPDSCIFLYVAGCYHLQSIGIPLLVCHIAGCQCH